MTRVLMKSRNDTDIFFMDEMPRNAIQTIVDYSETKLISSQEKANFK